MNTPARASTPRDSILAALPEAGSPVVADVVIDRSGLPETTAWGALIGLCCDRVVVAWGDGQLTWVKRAVPVSAPMRRSA
jgi:hypothetical protein